MRPAVTMLGPGREFDLIRGIWSRLGDRLGSGVGDDCALVEVGGAALAISTDVAVEGTHFRFGWLSHYEVGWRAAAAALSDLAAVAAQPAGVLVSLGVSAEWPAELVAEVMDGVGAAAASVGAKVWGGDLVRSERCVVDVVCVGAGGAAGAGGTGGTRRFVRRSGAQPGDGIWVTGLLGGPLAALEALCAGREPEAGARERFAHPLPRVREALWLAGHGATAMIDISDGLMADAGHLAAASGVHLGIDGDAVPAHASRAASPAPSPSPDFLTSGEEYELLVALPAAFHAADAFAATFALPVTRIGRVEQGAGVTLLRDGAPVEPPRGFAHF